jgi:sphinganine-1-phosphate aldolase
LLDYKVSLIHVDCMQVRNNPDKFGDGMAPIYGAAATMPDRGSVRDLLIAYMDGTC